MKGKRKTLNAGDVLSAMEEMEFQRFVAPLKESLEGTARSPRRGRVVSLVLRSHPPVASLVPVPSAPRCSLPGG